MKKYDTYIYENNNISLKEKLAILLNKAVKDCYENEESETIQELKDLLGFEFKYELGCTYNSIELSNFNEYELLYLLDLNIRQMYLMIYPQNYKYEDADKKAEYEKQEEIIKKINKVFDINSNHLLYFNYEIKKLYEKMYHDVEYIYETNVIQTIYDIREKLFFDFNSDVLTIYLNLIKNDNDNDTVENALLDNWYNVISFKIGIPDLSDKEEQKLIEIKEKSLNNILKYCEKNKNLIIKDACKTNSPEIPYNLYMLKKFGGVFLETITTFEYQKQKIVDSYGNIIEDNYNKFKTENLLNQKMIKLRNAKIHSKRFNI